MRGEKIRVPTFGRSKRLDIVTNWSDKLGGKYVKLLIDNTDPILIPVSSFLRLALLISEEEDKEKLVRIKTIPVRQFKKTVTIRLAKDFKQGQTITIPVEFNIPTKELLNVLEK